MGEAYFARSSMWAGAVKWRLLANSFAAVPRKVSRALIPAFPRKAPDFFHAKLFCLEVGIVEAVQQEVHQIRNNRFSTLCFQKVYQMVVGSGQEFYQNFADHTNFGLALIGDGQIVEIVDDVSAQLLELPDGRIGAGKEGLAGMSSHF